MSKGTNKVVGAWYCKEDFCLGRFWELEGSPCYHILYDMNYLVHLSSFIFFCLQDFISEDQNQKLLQEHEGMHNTELVELYLLSFPKIPSNS